MLDDITPGQTIRCTIVREPTVEDDRQTVARLMRRDIDIKRRLKSAQEHRMRTLHVRSRGKRPWAVRRKSARHALPKEGASWTMSYIPQLAPDFGAVAKYLRVEPA